MVKWKLWGESDWGTKIHHSSQYYCSGSVPPWKIISPETIAWKRSRSTEKGEKGAQSLQSGESGSFSELMMNEDEARWIYFMVWHDYEWGNISFEKITIMRKPMNKKKWENHKMRILNFCILLLFSFLSFLCCDLTFCTVDDNTEVKARVEGDRFKRSLSLIETLLAFPHSWSCWLWLIWTGISWAWSRAKCFRVSGQTEWRPTWKYVSSINYEGLDFILTLSRRAERQHSSS